MSLPIPAGLLTEYQANLAALVSSDGDMSALAGTTQMIRSRDRKVLALKKMAEDRLAAGVAPTLATLKEVFIIQHFIAFYGDLP